MHALRSLQKRPRKKGAERGPADTRSRCKSHLYLSSLQQIIASNKTQKHKFLKDTFNDMYNFHNNENYKILLRKTTELDKQKAIAQSRKHSVWLRPQFPPNPLLQHSANPKPTFLVKINKTILKFIWYMEMEST